MGGIKVFGGKIINEIKDIVCRFPGMVFFMIICCIFSPLGCLKSQPLFCMSTCGVWMAFVFEIALENLGKRTLD